MNNEFLDYATNIALARNLVVEATIALRNFKADLEEAKTVAKARLQGDCEGKDAESRKNSLAALVLSDARVRTCEGMVLRAESNLDRAQMGLDRALDERRAVEWAMRQEFVAAMRERNTEQMTVVASLLSNRIENATDDAMDDLPF